VGYGLFFLARGLISLRHHAQGLYQIRKAISFPNFERRRLVGWQQLSSFDERYRRLVMTGMTHTTRVFGKTVAIMLLKPSIGMGYGDR
jgi:hypothetical protein